MLKDIKIQKIKKQEIPAMCEVHKISWLATYTPEIYGLNEKEILAKDFDSPIKVNKWKSSIESDTYRLWVAKDGDKIVGFCGGRKGDNENDFSVVYILPAYQRMGIGRRFADEILKWFGKEKNIVVEVATKNTQAICFYQKIGFGDLQVSDAVILPFGSRIETVKLTLKDKNARN